jgi:uncharacterized membrane protein YedE/YeeE
MTIRDVTPGAAGTRAVLRRLALGIAAKVLVVAILDFVLLRIWAPNLINRHQDLALAEAIGCLAGAFAAAGWLAFQLFADIGRFNRERRFAASSRIRIIED